MEALERIKRALKTLLADRFDITHSTLEMESENADREDAVQVAPSH